MCLIEHEKGLPLAALFVDALLSQSVEDLRLSDGGIVELNEDVVEVLIAELGDQDFDDILIQLNNPSIAQSQILN